MFPRFERVLINTAIVGAFGVAGTTVYFKTKLQRKYTDSDLVKEPMKLLRGYPYAEQLLGKPIRNTRIKFNTVDIAHTPLTAQINIPVKGSRGTGTLSSFFERDKPGDEWVVKRLDLEVKLPDASKPKWTFYRQVCEEDSDNIVDEGNQSADIVDKLLSSKSGDTSSDSTSVIKGTDDNATERTSKDKKNLRWL